MDIYKSIKLKFKNFQKKNKFSKFFNNFITITLNVISNLFFRKPKNIFKQSFFDKLNVKNINPNYLLFFLSIIFFIYLVYLSIPGLIQEDNLQKKLTQKLQKEYNLEFALSSDINYSILPKPHFLIKDVVIFTDKSGYQKEFTQIKKLKIFIYQNNFFKKKFNIKKIAIDDANVFVEKSDFSFINKFLDNGFSKHPIKINKSKLFFKNNEGMTVTLLSLKNVLIHLNEINQEHKITTNGKIFNLPFTAYWSKSMNGNISETKVKFKKLKLSFVNLNKMAEDGKFTRNFKVFLKRSKLITNYTFQNDDIMISSNKSFIGNNKFNYNGSIDLDPFNFKIKSDIDQIDFKNFLKKIYLFKEIFSRELILNNNFNGNFNIKSQNVVNDNLFQKMDLRVNFVGETIEFNNSNFSNKKIGNLNVIESVLFDEKNSLLLKSKVKFEIKDINKFNRKFLISKKNKKEISDIFFTFIIDLDRMNLKIYNVSINSEKKEMSEELDDLVYNFNNGFIKINNFISLKNFIKKVVSTYDG